MRLASSILLAIALLTAAPASAQVDWDASRRVPADRSEVMLSFAPLVKRTAPAVVNIYTRRVVTQRVPQLLFNDPFFRRFFGDLAVPEQRRSRIENSLGSGTIVDPSGLVVTAAHVIQGSDEITVVLADRREFDAQVVQVDEHSDLALLRIPGGQELPYLPLGDSDAVQVGDLVLAIGNPFGVGQTVTSGIISATARSTVSEDGVFLQTDAAINPGNSGGPLIDMAGRVIGVNTAIYSQSGGSHGIGFAVPSNLVRAMLDGRRQTGRVMRPWLGGDGQAVTSDLAASLGMDRPHGVLVNDIYPGGPLDRAGVRVGDVVTAVEGRAVDDPVALRFRLSTAAPGGTVQLSILRRGREHVVAVPVEAAPEIPPRHATPISGDNPLSGATVANLSPALIEEMQLDATRSSGVVIVAIDPRSVAARVGLRVGDVLVAINGREIRGVEDVRAAVSRRARGWDVQIARAGRLMSLSIG